jgi:polyisoprenoid-binding protein YceI
MKTRGESRLKKKVLLCLAAAVLPCAALAAPESYTMDPYHTYVHFEIDHNGLSYMRGLFTRNSGKFTIDRAAKTGAAELSIDTASISTGDNDKGARPRARDEHLRTADFFNVVEYPRMTFKSSGVKFAGDNPGEIAGSLTLLGVTRPVTLKLDRWVCKDHPLNKRPICGGNASGTLKRSDFGMKYGAPNLGDELKLFLSFEAYKD